MRRVRTGPSVGLAGALLLMAALALASGLRPAGWLAGLGSAAVLTVALTAGMSRLRARSLGPADRITLARAVLVCGVAALAAGSPNPTALVSLTVVALLLDALDGWVARRTRTVSELGARFDLEVDAFLILVLSAYVAPTVGWWVLGLGLARYVLAAAGLVQPWLRAPLPPRGWCKVVAAVVGVVLTVAAADLLPLGVTRALLVVAAALLAESFGREVLDLWRQRPGTAAPPGTVAPTGAAGPAARPREGAAGAIGAAAVVWAALLLPDRTSELGFTTFLAIPVEALALAALALVLPPRAGRAVALAAGAALAVLALVRVADMGYYVVFDRPFDPTTDPSYLDSGVGVLADSVGRTGAAVVLVAAAVLLLGVLVVVPLAVRRLVRLVRGHRRPAARVVGSVAAVWAACALAGVHVGGGPPVAAATTAASASAHVTQLVEGVRDRRDFAREISQDAFEDVPSGRLLTGLRGKDVLLVFVESYGRVAVDGSLGETVRPALAAGTEALAAAGFSARSAYLTSPTFGAGSWLAHSTLQAGVWVDGERRYGQLLSGDRLTLSTAFGRAGWRTVGVVPANTLDWPEGVAFYGFDRLEDARTLGYAGPKLGYAPVPDQYTLEQLYRRELAEPGHPPVMAEVDLVSSHHPWAPLPRLVGWDEVGDGSVYDGMQDEGPSPAEVWADLGRLRGAYVDSVRYSLSAVVSFVRRYGDDDLVLVVLGDHQPSKVLTGEGVGHDVPVTVIARDPAVLRRVAGWGWRPGLDPGPEGTVWRMDRFRDRFLTAFGPR